MRELPKFVVERMKVAAPAGVHPDVDVLTAFVERALPASERAVVSEHLARCGECRELVALAVPPAEVIEPAGAKVGVRNWWRWPVLGAAVAAGIVVVAAVGSYQYRHRALQDATVAQNAEPTQVAAQPAPNQSGDAKTTPRPVTPSPRREATGQAESTLIAGKGAVETTDSSGWRTKSPGMAGSAGVSGGAGGPQKATKMAMAEPPRDLAFPPQAPPAQAMKLIPAPAPARRDAAGAASEAVEVKGSNEVVMVQAPPPSLNVETAELQSSTDSNDKVRRAKPPTVASNAPVGRLPVVSNTVGLQQVQHANWTISSTGSLQRSFDGGQTWQEVNVNANLGAYGNSALMIVADDRLSKTVAKDKEEKKAKQESVSAPVFRAVNAIGNEVWAGTSGGLLYHSADAGTTWAGIVPSAHGVMLTGDIVRIEFTDQLHGKITTSTSEIWTTADGGASWQKQ